MNSIVQPRKNYRLWQRRLFALLFVVFASAGLSSVVSAENFLDATGADALSKDWSDDKVEFLKVDQAFVLSVTLSDEGDFQARWDMPAGYYLYRHQFAMSAKDPDQLTFGELQIPAGKRKVDEYFGEVEVYYDNAQVSVPLVSDSSINTQIGITYQGCADAGLCYPPETKWFAYDGLRLLALAQAPLGRQAAVKAAAGGRDVAAEEQTLNVADTQEQVLAGALADESLWYALILFFIGGVGLAFTPCVLPMVPILSSIIVGEGEGLSKGRAFTLSAAYVLGMALTYAALGMLVGLFGAELNLQAALQSPGVLVFFAAIFVVLSLAMFGLYELRLPQALQDRLNTLGGQQQGGKHVSVFVMGSLSSLVVSPCVSAPLAGALIYISTTNDALLGGAALLALGLGMGLPLMMVGASGGHWLPRAGAWMNGVKAVFGVMLLAVAIWLLERVVPAAATLALWAMLLLGSGVYLGVLDSSPRQGVAQFGKAVGVVIFLWGLILLIGAGSGASDPLKPLARLSAAGAVSVEGVSGSQTPPQWLGVKSLADVEQYISQSEQPVILDLYADWCISCKTMERSVFPTPEVAARLRQFTLLRADVTRNDDIDRQLLNHYGLFGPPSLVFFGNDGREYEDVRIQGEVDAKTLESHLEAVLRSITNL